MIRDPSKSRLSFDDLVVYNADVNPLNKAESQERLAEVNNYIIEVETLVETMCLNLRVNHAPKTPKYHSKIQKKAQNRLKKFENFKFYRKLLKLKWTP